MFSPLPALRRSECLPAVVPFDGNPFVSALIELFGDAPDGRARAMKTYQNFLHHPALHLGDLLSFMEPYRAHQRNQQILAAAQKTAARATKRVKLAQYTRGALIPVSSAGVLFPVLLIPLFATYSLATAVQLYYEKRQGAARQEIEAALQEAADKTYLAKCYDNLVEKGLLKKSPLHAARPLGLVAAKPRRQTPEFFAFSFCEGRLNQGAQTYAAHRALSREIGLMDASNPQRLEKKLAKLLHLNGLSSTDSRAKTLLTEILRAKKIRNSQEARFAKAVQKGAALHKVEKGTNVARFVLPATMLLGFLNPWAFVGGFVFAGAAQAAHYVIAKKKFTAEQTAAAAQELLVQYSQGMEIELLRNLHPLSQKRAELLQLRAARLASIPREIRLRVLCPEKGQKVTKELQDAFHRHSCLFWRGVRKDQTARNALIGNSFRTNMPKLQDHFVEEFATVSAVVDARRRDEPWTSAVHAKPAADNYEIGHKALSEAGGDIDSFTADLKTLHRAARRLARLLKHINAAKTIIQQATDQKLPVVREIKPSMAVRGSLPFFRRVLAQPGR